MALKQDERALLQLVCERGQSYGDLAELLGIGEGQSDDVDAVIGERLADAAEVSGFVLQENGQLLDFHVQSP